MWYVQFGDHLFGRWAQKCCFVIVDVSLKNFQMYTQKEAASMWKDKIRKKKKQNKTKRNREEKSGEETQLKGMAKIVRIASLTKA